MRIVIGMLVRGQLDMTRTTSFLSTRSPAMPTLETAPPKTRKYRRSSEPKFKGRVPSGRDQEAHRLHSEGMKQEGIATRLSCSQPTVSRGIRQGQKWISA